MTALLNIDDIFRTVQSGKLGWLVASQISEIVSAFSRGLDSLEKRFQVISEAIRTAKASKSIFAIVWAVYDEHKVHADLPVGTMLPKYKLERLMVDGTQLDELKRLVSAMILERACDGRLLTEEGLPHLLYEWKPWARPEDFDICTGLLTSKGHLIDFLACFNPRPDNDLPTKKIFTLKALEGILDISKILPRIRSIYESPSFEALEEDKKAAIKAIIEHQGATSHEQAESSSGNTAD